MDYNQKYLDLKNQLDNDISQEELTLLYTLINHVYIRKLGQEKIIATPNPGFIDKLGNEVGEQKLFYNKWMSFISLDKGKQDNLTKFIYPKIYGFQLGVYVNQAKVKNPLDGANLIIFYAVEYLNLLSQVSNKTVDELLDIFGAVQEQNTLNMDLIKIAFGDVYIYPDESYFQLDTEEGKAIFEKYKELAN